jgi:hypothetical protein
MKKGTTEVVVDNQFVGTVDNRGRLSATKGNKMLAQINRDSEELLLPVKVNEREVGRLVNPSRARKANPRAFELMSEMGPEEEAMFLSLAILELVRRKA